MQRAEISGNRKSGTRADANSRGSEIRAFKEAQSIESVSGGMLSRRVALFSNHVVGPKKFEKVSWPVLRQNFDTFLLAARRAGKFVSILPSSLVIVASSRRRCVEYYDALLKMALVQWRNQPKSRP